MIVRAQTKSKAIYSLSADLAFTHIIKDINGGYTLFYIQVRYIEQSIVATRLYGHKK